jgi:hypothetical protein
MIRNDPGSDAPAHRIFALWHPASDASETAYVTHHANIDPRDVVRVSMYCQARCEQWFGEMAEITQAGLANLLVEFYGYQHASSADNCHVINLYYERDFSLRSGGVGDPNRLAADSSLARVGLREAMAPAFSAEIPGLRATNGRFPALRSPSRSPPRDATPRRRQVADASPSAEATPHREHPIAR